MDVARPGQEPAQARGGRGSLIAEPPLEHHCPRCRYAEQFMPWHGRPSSEVSLLIRPPGGTPFVGRDRELGLLLEETHRRHGFVVSGPSGVGRTRLLSEVAERVGTGNVALICGGPTRLATDVAAASTRLAGAMRLTGEPALLVVDDADMLAPEPLRSLAAAAGQGVTLLLAVNADSASACVVDDLGTELGLGRLELAALDDTAAGELLGALAAFELGPACVLRLVRLAEGMPRALVEVLSAAVRAGAVVAADGGWVLRTPFPLPARWWRVAAAVGELPDDQRRALELVVLAESIAPSRIERLVAPADLVSLELAGLLRVRPAVTLNGVPAPDALEVEASRPALRELVLQTMSVFRCRERLRELLGVYDPPAPHTAEWLRVILWRQEVGGGVDEAALLDAARFAHHLLRPELALTLAGSAWRGYGSSEAAVTLAVVLHAAARHGSADRVLAEAEARHGRLATILVCRARGHVLRGQLDEADAAVAAVDTDGGELCRAIVAYHQGRIAEAYERCTRLATVRDPAVRAEAAIYVALSLGRMGRPRTALRAMQHFHAIRERAATAHDVHFPMLGTAPDVVAAELAAAGGDLTGAYEALVDDGRPPSATRGPVENAQRRIARAAMQFDLGRTIDALAGYATVARSSGAGELSRRAAATGRAIASAGAEPERDQTGDAIGRAWRARLVAGDAEVVRILTEAMEAASSRGAHGDVAVAVHQMGRLGVAESAEPWWHVPVEGPLLRARLNYARALATGDAQLLGEVAEAFAAVRANLYAAESFAQLATLHRRHGDPRAAAAASRRTRQLAATCQSATTPALLLPTTVQPLSKREREIALLARNGFTDHEIAGRLCLSIRTVQNHLSRVYHKCGIKGRQELRVMPT